MDFNFKKCFQLFDDERDLFSYSVESLQQKLCDKNKNINSRGLYLG